MAKRARKRESQQPRQQQGKGGGNSKGSGGKASGKGSGKMASKGCKRVTGDGRPICYRFNDSGGCKEQGCRFAHVCGQCFATDHSIANCPQKK